MQKLKNKNVPLLWQLSVLIVQFVIYLSINWLDIYINQKPPISSSDKFFWSVIVPITWLVYMLMSYHYSHKLLRAIIQGLLQTLVSYAIVITSVLAFYTWIG